MADQIGQHLANVIKSLRPNLRKVFVMAHVQGKPRREIAAALGISEKRVDKRMTKALKACRDRLASQGIDLAEVE
jgi:RNA polymerase sigma factor (sigma-70 family)